jgi:N-carbamoyl-L-amino-acid hydrolase
VVLAAFTEEEGARFGVSVPGQPPAHRRHRPADGQGLTDDAGVTLAEAMIAAGSRPG